MAYIRYDATFNSNLLTSITGLTILATNPYIPARRKLSLNDIARTNKAKTNSAFYMKKAVMVRVSITRATRDLLEQSIDSLMTILQGIEKELLLTQAGGTRKYTCTLADTIVRNDGGSYCEIDLIFETSDHFGYDNAPTLLKQVSGFTSGQKTDQITVGGSAPWQVPKLTLTYSAVTDGTSKNVIIGNDATGQSVTITRTWVAGDVLEIDALNQTVKVNGTEVDFDGAIPEWAPGIGYISYSDTFSARTFSYTLNYYKRYI